MGTRDMSRIRRALHLLVVLSVSGLFLQARASQESALCEEIVTTLVPQFIFKVPTSDLERVEIRKCFPGLADSLQLVAWQRAARKPSLVLETTDFTIVQLVMSGRVFVVETTGGTRDIVWVITYQSGVPKLALKAITKGYAVVTSDYKRVSIEYPDLNKQIRQHSFDTNR